ncbi:MAG: hypothetical protein AB7G28_03650 [Pirellulales bacterium]
MAKLNGIHALAVAGAGAMLWGVSGCGGMDEASRQTESRLRVISVAYLEFAAARGQGPANETELRNQLAESVAAKITRQKLGVEDAPSLLVSERDGATFIVRYGVPIETAQGARAAPIALEAKGREGTQFVAFADGKVECVDAQSLTPLRDTVAKNR